MAAEGEEEVDYESDPEEALLPLTMRRREASDDEEGDEEEIEKSPRNDPRSVIGSDGESEGEGGAPGYDDEESEIEEEEEEEEEEEVEEVDEGEREFEERVSEGRADVDAGEVEVQVAAPGSGGDGGQSSGEPNEFQSENQNQAEDERKENEPFAVPTAGAFYMHDDRFRDSGSGRHRRTPGGRKLWESKDDRKWGHDKFEEMNLQEIHYEGERRKSKSHYRGPGKNRGTDHGNARGTRSRGYSNSNNQNHSSKSVRGRGPRRYEPPAKYNSEPPTNQNKQSGKVIETASNASSGRVHTSTKNLQSDRVPPRKNAFASSLNSASPPFYPSGSSNQDIPMPQKRDVQSGNGNRNLSPSGMEDNYSRPHSNSYRGKNVGNPIGLDRLYVGESIRPVSGKQLTNLQLQASGTSPIITTQSPQSRAQGRGLAMPGQLSYQPTSPLNQVNRVTAEALPSFFKPRPVQIPSQPLRASTQHLGQRPGTGSQASSPPIAPSRNSPEPGESESPPSSSKSKTALVGKGKGNIQGSGRGSFLYNGTQVIGATGSMGVAHGDQNFPATPALLPVMQFGGQHPGGLGVPAVGMALPGYVAQPQLGFGNSEMTWVPVLAGAAAGALGATYYAVDGGYYARQSGQTSSMGSSGKETSSNKPNNVWKSPPKPELVNDEFGQRQNKPRRYSEMNFGQ
ncbi:protein MLN51 homolog [Telopea speciosissima]|uniref:protein MLN51 homolog n=1 Tax=Telopea speciosissima TaxID=54955 RepID=UPI001CC3D7C5|nr:protein MLN51 homolog [Telopea speciosissima]XP_043724489.1 protein MLN51 homolog [Telopea speciosissima]XP_043724490.1 protein MLN51 homolog [Telopea speciosissima]